MNDHQIGFHKTSDELHQFHTPIPIPYADDLEVPGICIAESHSGIPPLETCSITSASIPPHVATVNMVQSSIGAEIQTACRPKPYCDVTSTKEIPPLDTAATAFAVSVPLVLPESPTMTDKVNLDDCHDRSLMPVLSNVQADPHPIHSPSS